LSLEAKSCLLHVTIPTGTEASMIIYMTESAYLFDNNNEKLRVLNVIRRVSCTHPPLLLRLDSDVSIDMYCLLGNRRPWSDAFTAANTNREHQ
jgi:hypothetical protein